MILNVTVILLRKLRFKLLGFRCLGMILGEKCTVTSRSYTGDDGVVNKTVPLFAEYFALTD